MKTGQNVLRRHRLQLHFNQFRIKSGIECLNDEENECEILELVTVTKSRYSFYRYLNVTHS